MLAAIPCMVCWAILHRSLPVNYFAHSFFTASPQTLAAFLSDSHAAPLNSASVGLRIEGKGEGFGAGPENGNHQVLVQRRGWVRLYSSGRWRRGGIRTPYVPSALHQG